MRGAKLQREKFLRRLWSNWLLGYIGNRVRRTSHKDPFGVFEALVATRVNGDALAYVVGEDDSYRLSEVAGRHWLELGIPALVRERKDFVSWPNSFGYELGPLPDPIALLRKNEQPLLEVHDGKKKRPWLVAVVRGELVGNRGVGPQTLTDVPAQERTRVARIAKTCVCECFLCERLRTESRRWP